MEKFEDMIARERARLAQLRDDLMAQQENIFTQLAEIDRELDAISAYERAKTGKPAREPKAAKASRAPRGAKREALLSLIEEQPNLTRGQIIEKLGIKGDKAGEQSISNALASMKKAGTVIATDGRYAMAKGA